MKLRNSVCLLFAAAISIFATNATGQADPPASASLFDGQTLQGWNGDKAFWSVQDGMITGQSTSDNRLKQNTFLIWEGEVSDFELKLQVRIESGNSGIQYRSRDLGDFVVGGYQCDLDVGHQYSGILYEEQGRGFLARVGQKVEVSIDGKPESVGTTASREEVNQSIAGDEWIDYRIVAQGNHLQHYINDQLAIDVTDHDPRGRRRGVLALQLHAGDPMKVQYRNIELTPLKPQIQATADNVTRRKVLFLPGSRSHGYGSHEFNAGCILLAKHLQKARPDYDVELINVWPSDPSAFDGVDAVVIYCDGGRRHPALKDLETFRSLIQSNVGIACMHYGVEVPTEAAGPEFLDAIGGFFETHWSVNPHWVAKFTSIPEHPVTRGVQPFEMNDEWYFHMRFRDGMEGVTPLLSAVAPASTMQRKDGPHSGNPHVRAAVAAGEPQHLAWVAQRKSGGRGFGFTGGHFHSGWGDVNMRRLVLNAIVWLAHDEVPADGMATGAVSAADLEENQDFPKPKPAKKAG